QEIADATREGRRNEFAAFAQFKEEIPDPQDRATFERSKLTRERDETLARLYRDLLNARTRLPSGDVDRGEFDEEQRWLGGRRGRGDARADDRAPGAQLALLSAGDRSRAALRVPRARPILPAGGASLQPEQAADRPLCEGDRRRRRLGARAQCAALRSDRRG